MELTNGCALFDKKSNSLLVTHTGVGSTVPAEGSAVGQRVGSGEGAGVGHGVGAVLGLELGSWLGIRLGPWLGLSLDLIVVGASVGLLG
jgi:hypothetical protein